MGWLAACCDGLLACWVAVVGFVIAEWSVCSLAGWWLPAWVVAWSVGVFGFYCCCLFGRLVVVVAAAAVVVLQVGVLIGEVVGRFLSWVWLVRRVVGWLVGELVGGWLMVSW